MTRARLVVFSKHDCGLCDELKARLRHRQIPFEECDIRQREDWFERYRERMPVVKLPDGKEYDPPFSDALIEGWTAQNI
jgi:glutaredoxin